MVIVNLKAADSATHDADENLGTMNHLLFICMLDTKNKTLLMPKKPAPKIDPGIMKSPTKKTKKKKKYGECVDDIDSYYKYDEY